MTQQAKFNELLGNIRGQLLQGQVTFDAWFGLIHGEDKDTLDTLNGFKGFFKPAIDALRDRCILKIANIMEPTDNRAASFYRLIKMLQNDPDLIPNVDSDSLRVRIDELKKMEQKVRYIRDKRVAHYDLDTKLDDIQLDLFEIKELLEQLENVYNNVHKTVNPGETYYFHVVQKSDTRNLLQSLQSYHEPVPKLLNPLREAQRRFLR